MSAPRDLETDVLGCIHGGAAGVRSRYNPQLESQLLLATTSLKDFARDLRGNTSSSTLLPVMMAMMLRGR